MTSGVELGRFKPSWAVSAWHGQGAWFQGVAQEASMRGPCLAGLGRCVGGCVWAAEAEAATAHRPLRCNQADRRQGLKRCRKSSCWLSSEPAPERSLERSPERSPEPSPAACPDQGAAALMLVPMTPGASSASSAPTLDSLQRVGDCSAICSQHFQQSYAVCSQHFQQRFAVCSQHFQQRFAGQTRIILERVAGCPAFVTAGS